MGNTNLRSAFIMTNHLPFFYNGHIVYNFEKDVDVEGQANTPELRDAFVVELANLGYKVTNPEKIELLTVERMRQTILDIREEIGLERDTTPVYPGFPEQVKELSTATLLVEQMLHYLSGGVLIPDYPDVIREGLSVEDALKDAKELTIISAEELEEFVVEKIVSKPTPFSENDKYTVESFFAGKTPDEQTLHNLYVNSAHNENMQHVVYLAQKSGLSSKELFNTLAPVTKNLNRLLRLYLVLYTEAKEGMHSEFWKEAVFSLNKEFFSSVRKLKTPNSVRKMFTRQLSLLSHGSHVDDVLKYKSMWRALCVHVHAFDYAKDPATKRVLEIIFDNVKHQTVNAQIENAIVQADVKTATDLLVEYKKGGFLRHINNLLRISATDKEAQYVIDNVYEVALKAPFPTVISVYNAVLNVNSKHQRLIIVPGHKNHLVDKSRKDVNTDYIVQTLGELEKAIVEKLSAVKAPKTVGVNSTVPVTLRTRDVALTGKLLKRGTKIHVPVGDGALRLFSFWTASAQQSGYIDLGVILLDEDFNHLGAISWNSWQKFRDCSTYSGDKLVDSGDSAAEYFDVDITKIKNLYPKLKYLAVTLQSYSGYPLNEVDVVAGVMARKHPDSGEVFEPLTIENSFKPTTSALQSVPYLYNIEEEALIWVDSSSGSSESGMSATGDRETPHVLRSELSPKMTYGHLAQLWAYAHNSQVDNDVLADVEVLDELLKI